MFSAVTAGGETTILIDRFALGDLVREDHRVGFEVGVDQGSGNLA
jgi:hypothetical protein